MLFKVIGLILGVAFTSAAVAFDDYRPEELCADVAVDLTQKDLSKFDQYFDEERYQQRVQQAISEQLLLHPMLKNEFQLRVLVDKFLAKNRDVLVGSQIHTWSGVLIKPSRPTDEPLCALMSQDVRDEYVLLGIKIERDKQDRLIISDYYDFQSNQSMLQLILEYVNYMSEVMMRPLDSKDQLQNKDMTALIAFLKALQQPDQIEAIHSAYDQLNVRDQYAPMILRRYIEVISSEPDVLANAANRYLQVGQPTGLLNLQVQWGRQNFLGYQQAIDRLEQDVGRSISLSFLRLLEPNQQHYNKYVFQLVKNHAHEQGVLSFLLMQSLKEQQDERALLILQVLYKRFGDSLKDAKDITSPDTLRFLKTPQYQAYLRFLAENPIDSEGR